MELALVVYFISLMDAISSGLVVSVVIVTVIAAVVCAITGSEQDTEEDDKWSKRSWRFCSSLFFTVPLLTIFVWLAPDKETSYTMLAAYGVQTVAQDERVQDVMGRSLEVLELHMAKYIEDSTENTEK